MATYKDILEANKSIGTMDIKGKEYALVNQRVKAFRMVYPMGSITTEIIAMEAGIVTIKATINAEDGIVIATGYAQEKETASYINKTSYIENCETSAVGRALGFAGFGIDTSICSAEELNNAIEQQTATATPSATARATARASNIAMIHGTCKKHNINIDEILQKKGKSKLSDLNDTEILNLLTWLERQAKGAEK